MPENYNVFFIMPAKLLINSLHLGKKGGRKKLRTEKCFKSVIYMDYWDYVTLEKSNQWWAKITFWIYIYFKMWNTKKFERQAGRQADTQRQKGPSFIKWFSPQMPASEGPGQSWEPGTQSGKTQRLEPIASWVCNSRKLELEVERGLKRTLKRDVSIPRGAYTVEPNAFL